MYVLAEEEGREIASKALATDSWNRIFDQVYTELKGALGEKPSGTALDSARSDAKHKADLDRHVVEWRGRATRHAIESRMLKALHEGYEKATARLSREQTRRVGEFESSRSPKA